jgi:hypothetical protein
VHFRLITESESLSGDFSRSALHEVSDKNSNSDFLSVFDLFSVSVRRFSSTGEVSLEISFSEHKSISNNLGVTTMHDVSEENSNSELFSDCSEKCHF